MLTRSRSFVYGDEDMHWAVIEYQISVVHRWANPKPCIKHDRQARNNAYMMRHPSSFSSPFMCSGTSVSSMFSQSSSPAASEVWTFSDSSSSWPWAPFQRLRISWPIDSMTSTPGPSRWNRIQHSSVRGRRYRYRTSYSIFHHSGCGCASNRRGWHDHNGRVHRIHRNSWQALGRNL